MTSCRVIMPLLSNALAKKRLLCLAATQVSRKREHILRILTCQIDICRHDLTEKPNIDYTALTPEDATAQIDKLREHIKALIKKYEGQLNMLELVVKSGPPEEALQLLMNGFK